MRFKDREDAGRALAEALEGLVAGDCHILAIPNGGVPVAVPVWRRLDAGMDLIVIRKIQFPHNTEAGFGAVSSTGEVHYNRPLMRSSGLTPEQVEAQTERTRSQIRRRLERYGIDPGRPPPDMADRTAVLIDDGLASGFTMIAAVETVRRSSPREIIVAVPTAPARSVRKVEDHADRVLALDVREGPFFAVADAYDNWYDVSDDEVMDIIEEIGLS